MEDNPISYEDFERLFKREKPKDLRDSFELLLSRADCVGEDAEMEAGRYSRVLKGRFNEKAVAIKRFRRGKTDKKQGKDIFLKEFYITSQLRHPHVVSFLGHHPGTLSLIFELMSPGALDYYLFDRSRVIGTQTGLQIAHHVAEALRYLHEVKKVIHMDVKSSNVLLSCGDKGEMTAKLADFGLSKRWREDADPTEKLESLSGTPEWMAPELLLLKLTRHVSPPSDVYSFGVLLWQIYTREAPFGRHGLKSIIHLKKMEQTPSVPLSVPLEIKSILHSCWASDPTDRPSMERLGIKLNIISNRV